MPDPEPLRARRRPLRPPPPEHEPAERIGLDDASVDLVVAGQAAHWFDLPAFLARLRALWGARERTVRWPVAGRLATLRPPARPTTPELRVGVGVLIRRGERVLLGLRRGAHGSGTWALPGGHLEPGESIGDCARRETLEETGLAVGEVRHADFTGDVFAEVDRHYVTLFVEAEADVHAEPANLEPDRCERWAWHAWDDLPEPLFPALRTLVDQGYRPGRRRR